MQKKYIFRFEYGIGLSRYNLLLFKLGLNFNVNIKKFLHYNINVMKRYKIILFYNKWVLVNKLKFKIQQYLKFSKIIYNYRYIRFKFGLPVNGQRTHTNRKNSMKGYHLGKISLTVK